jgi:hypothetical protein
MRLLAAPATGGRRRSHGRWRTNQTVAASRSTATTSDHPSDDELEGRAACHLRNRRGGREPAGSGHPTAGQPDGHGDEQHRQRKQPAALELTMTSAARRGIATANAITKTLADASRDGRRQERLHHVHADEDQAAMDQSELPDTSSFISPSFIWPVSASAFARASSAVRPASSSAILRVGSCSGRLSRKTPFGWDVHKSAADAAGRDRPRRRCHGSARLVGGELPEVIRRL